MQNKVYKYNIQTKSEEMTPHCLSAIFLSERLSIFVEKYFQLWKCFIQEYYWLELSNNDEVTNLLI